MARICCCISGGTPVEPVFSSTGYVYEKSLIEPLIDASGKCPMTQLDLTKADLTPIRIGSEAATSGSCAALLAQRGSKGTSSAGVSLVQCLFHSEQEVRVAAARAFHAMEKRIADVGPALGRFIEENKTDSVITASDRTIAVLEKLYNVEEKDGEEALKAMKSHFAYIINGHFKRAGYTSTEVVSRLLRNRDRRARAAVFRTFVCEYEPEASFLLATPEQSDEDWRLASAPDTKCRLKGSDDASRKLKLVVEQPAWIGRGLVEEAAARHSDGTDCAERLLYYIITEAVSESDDDIDAGGEEDSYEDGGAEAE